MGKIEDMRRQREQQFADAAAREAKAAKAPPRAATPVAAPVPAEPTKAVTKAVTRAAKPNAKSEAGDEQGKCPDCGKTKPLSNGVMANHQKGFGKACSGSRKKPV